MSYWSRVEWWAYVGVTLPVAMGAFAFHRKHRPRWRAGSDRPLSAGMRRALPVCYALYCALLGGSQLIVHAKVFSVLLSMLLRGDTSVLRSWLLYVELLLVSGCGLVWAWRLTACLVLYDPLLILPLMVGTYILFGGLAGGLYFGEVANLASVEQALRELEP